MKQPRSLSTPRWLTNLFVHHLADGDDDLIGLNGDQVASASKAGLKRSVVVKDAGAAFELDASDGAVAEDAVRAPSRCES